MVLNNHFLILMLILEVQQRKKKKKRNDIIINIMNYARIRIMKKIKRQNCVLTVLIKIKYIDIISTDIIQNSKWSAVIFSL
jgi:hypothetical protein